MPQLDQSFYPSQIFWLLIGLVILYVYLSCVFVPRMRKHFARREKSSADKLQQAQEMVNQAKAINAKIDKKLQSTKQQAAKIIADAKNQSSETLEAQKKEFTQIIDKRITAAKENIAAKQSNINKDIPSIAQNLSDIVIKKLNDNGKNNRH